MKSNSSKFYTSIAILSLVVMGFKLLSVFYATSRGVGLGYPYDSMVFEQFHRFTDWLIPIEFSKLNNPFDTNDELYKHLPPTPYGILTFWILSLSKYINPLPLFFSILTAILLINYIIFTKIVIIETGNRALTFLALLITSYPLYLAIDRGNADIIAVLIISLFVLNEIDYKSKKISIILLTILISLKPSWGLFGICIFYYPGRYIILSISVIIALYTFPIFYSSASYDYMLTLIKMALPIIDNTNTFCHNFSCAIRVFWQNTQSLDIVIVVFGILINIAICIKLLIFSPNYNFQRKLLISFTFATFTTLLINNPSPDYRLLILMPFTQLAFYNMDFFDIQLNKIQYYFFTISYTLIFSFINIPIVDFPPIYTLLRFVGVFVIFIICIFLFLIQNNVKKIK